jgi:hypothetical protein
MKQEIDVGHVGLRLRQDKRFQGTLEENEQSFATDAHLIIYNHRLGELTFHFDWIYMHWFQRIADYRQNKNDAVIQRTEGVKERELERRTMERILHKCLVA